jgi:hypothetical protein
MKDTLASEIIAEQREEAKEFLIDGEKLLLAIVKD